MTRDEVQLLNDDQLRDLLRLLLKAEARQQGIPLSSIFVGGDQNAADGGLDGRIEWIGDPEPAGWIPRRKIFFQSTAEKMLPAKLSRELAPDGSPRALY